MRRLLNPALVLRIFRIALQLAVLLLLVLVVRPAQMLIQLGSQQHVHTQNELAGVHTRFVDEAEEWKIQRGLILVREMGAPWIVEFFPWAYYEKSRGQFDWRSADRIVDHANRQGLRVIARLGFVPDWARPATTAAGRATTFTHLDEADYGLLADFAAAFVSHFQGRIQHVIIWNEPNLTSEWGLRPVDAAAYVRMLQRVYPAIKAANPEVQVLVGALAPTLEPVGSAQGLNDLLYLKQMYAVMPAQRPYDAWAIHSYGQTAAPEAASAPDRLNFRRTELVRQIMVDHGDVDVPVYITEAGWNDDPRWANGVSPAQRIAYTLAGLDYAKAHWQYVRCVALWVFKLPAPAHNYRDHFTFVDPALQPLPIYEEIKRRLTP